MNNPTPNLPRKSAVERFFYPGAALLLLVLTVIGFQLFYFQGKAYPGRELTPPIKTLVIAHGLAMTAWILLAVVQPFLVAGGNRRVHMALGRVAAIFAILLVVLGFQTGIASTRVAPPGMMFGELTPKQFMAVPILAITLFAIFVAGGVWWRKRSEIHRPLMFMASMTVVGAAISRIDFLNHLYAGTVWQKVFGDLFFTVAIAGVIAGARMILLRSVDRWLGTAFGVLTVWSLMIVHGAKTPVWDSIATFLLR